MWVGGIIDCHNTRAVVKLCFVYVASGASGRVGWCSVFVLAIAWLMGGMTGAKTNHVSGSEEVHSSVLS